MGSWLKRLWDGYGRVDSVWSFVTSDLTKPWLYPAIAAMMTLVAAFSKAVPLPYLIASACLAGASVATAMVRVDEWWSRVNPSGKLSFSIPLFALDIDKTEEQHRLKKIQMGFSMYSSATFPLYFQVYSVFTHFMGRVAINKNYDRSISEVPAGGNGWFRDAPIQLDTDFSESLMEGE